MDGSKPGRPVLEGSLTSHIELNLNTTRLIIFMLFSGIGLLREMSSANVIVIVSIVSASIVLLLIAIVIAILLCRKRKPTEKCKLYEKKPCFWPENVMLLCAYFLCAFAPL